MAEKKKPDEKKPKSSKKTTTAKSSSTAKAPFTKAIYDTLVQNVSVIILHDKTISLLKKDKTLQETIDYYIDAIYTYELAVKPKEKQCDTLKSGYDAVTSNDLVLNKLNKTELEELEDKIHFLPIYLKNSSDIDWDEVLKSLGQTNKTAKIQNAALAAAVATGTASNAKAEKIETVEAQKTEFNSSEYMRRNNISMEQIAEGMIQQQAQAILWRDIANGKFYKYKTKPTFFIWAKWILFTLWILTAIILLIQQIIPVSISRNYLFIFGDSNTLKGLEVVSPPSSAPSGPSAGGSTPGGAVTTRAVDAILAGTTQTMTLDFNKVKNSGDVIPLVKNMGLMSMLFSLLIPICIFMYAWGQVKNNQNENAKFTCRTFVTWILLIFAVSVFAGNINNANIFNFAKLNQYKDQTFGDITSVSISNTNLTFALDQNAAYKYILSIWVTQIIYIVLISLTVIVSVAIIVTRPKIDSERVQARVAQIKEEIKSGKIDTDLDNGGMFGGMRNPFSPY